MSDQSTTSHATSTSGAQASFGDVHKRRTQHSSMATANVASGNNYGANKTFNAMNDASSGTPSATALDEQPLLPKSAISASKDADTNKPKPKPLMLDLSIRNVYYTHSPSGKSSIGSPGFPSGCDLM